MAGGAGRPGVVSEMMPVDEKELTVFLKVPNFKYICSLSMARTLVRPVPSL